MSEKRTFTNISFDIFLDLAHEKNLNLQMYTRPLPRYGYPIVFTLIIVMLFLNTFDFSYVLLILYSQSVSCY